MSRGQVPAFLQDAQHRTVPSEEQASMSAGQSILSGCSVIKNTVVEVEEMYFKDNDYFLKIRSTCTGLYLESVQVNFEILQTFGPFATDRHFAGPLDNWSTLHRQITYHFTAVMAVYKVQPWSRTMIQIIGQ